MDFIARNFKHPWAELGTPAVIALSLLIYAVGRQWIHRRNPDPGDQYQKRQVLGLVLALLTTVIVVVLWARLLERTGTFLGLIGGGLAIALREPLLALAGRIALLAGGAYRVGDRVQVEDLIGDVVDVGFIYTRVLEIGHWVGGDQATGRFVQFSNSKLFGTTPVYNYTRNFDFIWDEIVLPVTYRSNIQRAREILLQHATEYTRDFLQGAENQVKAMHAIYYLPSIDLKPEVYMTVTSNWVELRMRYLVHPKQRRTASNYLWQKIFPTLQAEPDIAIASQTEDLTIHTAKEDQSSRPLQAISAMSPPRRG